MLSIRLGRHKEEGSAVTHVRISKQTKQLLHDLRLKHGFATTDQVLRYYLPSDVSDNRPVFHSAREIYNFTKQQRDIDQLINDVSSGLQHIINKSGPGKSITKPVRKTSWRKRRNW